MSALKKRSRAFVLGLTLVGAGFLVCAGLSGCAGAPGAAPPGPPWIYNPRTAYPEDRYVSAVGYGLDRESAEKNALGNLTAVFGQTVEGELLTTYRYAEAVAEGLINIRESREIENAVRTSFTQETLIGAEIREVWFDGHTHYAAAVMDKPKCRGLYAELIASNEAAIQNLTAMTGPERESFEGHARYELAAAIAGANAALSGILGVLSDAAPGMTLGGGFGGSFGEGLSREEDLRLEAREILRRIPVAVLVEGDRGGRVGAAFTRVIADQGFLAGGEGGRYVLEAALSLEEAVLPQNPNQFVRYVIDARLQDRATGQILFAYNINGREGHVSTVEAENRALRAAEARIGESFAAAFADYLVRLK